MENDVEVNPAVRLGHLLKLLPFQGVVTTGFTLPQSAALGCVLVAPSGRSALRNHHMSEGFSFFIKAKLFNL